MHEVKIKKLFCMTVYVLRDLVASVVALQYINCFSMSNWISWIRSDKNGALRHFINSRVHFSDWYKVTSTDWQTCAYSTTNVFHSKLVHWIQTNELSILEK